MSEKENPRSLWPVAIIGFFILGIAFLVIFIVWASHQREDLVAENYYETEIKYQQQVDRLNQSQPFDSLPIVTYDAEQQHIIISLPDDTAKNATGSVHLYRPSDARLDRALPLAVNTKGIQHLDAKPLSGGLWKVRVQWSAAGKEYYCDRSVIL